MHALPVPAWEPCSTRLKGWNPLFSAPRLNVLPLRRGSSCLAHCVRMTSACGLLQDKMLTRVETARKEMQHIGDFDYGKPPPAMIWQGFL